MISACQEIELDKSVIEYVSHCLRQGNTLSQHVDKNFLDFSGQKIFSYLPSECQKKPNLNFKQGGVISKEISLEYLTEKIKQFLKENKSNFCILENILAKSTDQRIRPYHGKFFFYESEVYHLLTSEDTDSTLIKTVIMEAEAPHLFIAWMCSGQIEPPVKKINRVSLNELSKYASQMQQLILSVYDGEAYLFTKSGVM